MTKIKAGIIGAAGYTGGELIRILLRHPHVDIVWAQSNSQADKPVYYVHKDLLGETDLGFSQHQPADAGPDVLFLCLGHGEARKYLDENGIAEKIRIIDLSQDFRVNGTWGNQTFVYGLPEWQKENIRQATHIANPGCFATAIQLALLPLAQAGSLAHDIHVSGITGSTGAGKSLSDTSHFSWRNNNISSYKVLEHQHLAEIRHTLAALQPTLPEINFVPYRGNFSRGILATTYTTTTLHEDEAIGLYEAYYTGHPFIHISAEAPDLKQVVNTNKCLLHLEKKGNKLIITSAIDNLLKGASGQAVQNMNLMFDLEETTGLQFKSIAF